MTTAEKTTISGKLDVKLVAQYFNVYRRKGRIWIQRHPEMPGSFLIANQFVCVCVTDHVRLAAYTAFPKDVEAVRLSPGEKFVECNKTPFGLWSKWISEDVACIEPSRYLYEANSMTCRVFLDEAGQETLINKEISDMIASDVDGLEEFIFGQEAPDRAVRVAGVSGYCMVVMPATRNK